MAPSVAQRKNVLETLLSPFGSLARLGEAPSRALWRAIRDVAPFAAAGPAGARDLWRISTAPSRGAEAGRTLVEQADAELLYDWAGGLVWAALPAADDAGAPLVRATVAAAGGHATLIRAPAAVRAAVDVFTPEPAGACRIDETRAGELRSKARAQRRAHVGGRIAMQTSFTLTQLADPDVAEAEKILRACVHCGFCTATCPTYVLDGNELDSPRGRIYLIKDMLEHDRPATADVALHIDRCLSCLACMTTCPSGVHYMHLVDHARVHIERTYRRPLGERLLRATLVKLMPYPRRFRLALAAALVGKPFAPLAAAIGLKRLAAMLRLAPWHRPQRPLAPQTFPALGARKKGRVVLLAGCVNDLLAPEINAAAIRVLTRHDIEVVLPNGAGCCGSLVHHMGRERQALAQARANIDAWTAIEAADAILITASGCGTTVKDYGFMLRTDPAYAETRGPRRQPRQRYHRISRRPADLRPLGRPRPRRRLSRRLLAAARPANHAAAKGIARQAGLRGEGRAGRSFVLRLGRHLQYSAARHRKEVARAQSRDYREIAT